MGTWRDDEVAALLHGVVLLPQHFKFAPDDSCAESLLTLRSAKYLDFRVAFSCGACRCVPPSFGPCLDVFAVSAGAPVKANFDNWEPGEPGGFRFGFGFDFCSCLVEWPRGPELFRFIDFFRGLGCGAGTLKPSSKSSSLLAGEWAGCCGAPPDSSLRLDASTPEEC